MTPADVLPAVDRPTLPGAEIDQRAAAAVERVLAELVSAPHADGGDELRTLDALARAATRLAAAHRPERRAADADIPVGAAGWWSFAAQLPELDG